MKQYQWIRTSAGWQLAEYIPSAQRRGTFRAVNGCSYIYKEHILEYGNIITEPTSPPKPPRAKGYYFVEVILNTFDIAFWDPDLSKWLMVGTGNEFSDAAFKTIHNTRISPFAAEKRA